MIFEQKMTYPTGDNLTVKPRFALADHPWVGTLVFIITSLIVIIWASVVVFVLGGLSPQSSHGQILQSLLHHCLTLFVITPFILNLPNGKTPFRQYLSDIRLNNFHPFFKLLFLSLSCYLILVFCQASGPVVFRLSQGHQLTWSFILSVFDIRGDLPPDSASLWVSLPSAFEEIAFRGVVLTLFLRRYSGIKAIVFSSLAFGLIHFTNLLNGSEAIWVTGQVGWAFILGLGYGYLTLKTNSLFPAMLLHYLSNVFVGSFTAYLQAAASIQIYALYGLIFTFGGIPTSLIILWVRWFWGRWLKSD
jgi:membrane protease YdiL (CAAX protease family)